MAKDEIPNEDPVPNLCELPAHPTLEAVQTVYENLIAARAEPVDVDASHVGRISAPLLQVLILAHQEWTENGLPFRISGASEAFKDGAELLGLQEDFFEMVDAA